jgi:superfamily I DNA and/or RNA helicase
MVLKALQQSEGFDEFMKAQKKPEDKEIGIITFYSAQSREIKRKYKDCGYRMDVVDRFQGMERNIIIVSTVRSNAKNNIGFAKEIERINVAFSRARRLLIVVGNKRQFESNSNYAASIQSMKTFPVEQLRAALR